MLVAVFKVFPVAVSMYPLARLLFGDDKGGLLAGEADLAVHGPTSSSCGGLQLFYLPG